jgi:hypothetical protein
VSGVHIKCGMMCVCTLHVTVCNVLGMCMGGKLCGGWYPCMTLCVYVCGTHSVCSNQKSCTGSIIRYILLNFWAGPGRGQAKGAGTPPPPSPTFLPTSQHHSFRAGKQTPQIGEMYQNGVLW